VVQYKNFSLCRCYCQHTVGLSTVHLSFLCSTNAPYPKTISIMKLSFALAAALTNSLVGSARANEGALRGDISNEQNDHIVSLPLIPFHKHPRAAEIESYQEKYDMSRRRRRLDNENFETIMDNESGEQGQLFDTEVDALFQGYGTHYVDLWVGTPPQRQTVIVDTGSSVTAFPCEECIDCGDGYHVDKYFNEDDSSSFHRVECGECILGSCNSALSQCTVSVAYQEGSSWYAYEAQDLVYTGGPHDIASDEDNFPMNFGCQTRLTGLFKTQLADGIMGMEMKTDSYWHQWYHHFKDDNYEKKFSLCFARQSAASRDGTHAGAMTMGGTDLRLHGSKMLYVNQYQESGWFVVRIAKIFLRSHGGMHAVVDVDSNPEDVVIKQVDVSETSINSGNIILDSGTTDTYLSSSIMAPFQVAWKELTGFDYSNAGTELSDEDIANLPTVLFQLRAEPTLNEDSLPGLVGELDPLAPKDVIVAMPPTHYMEYSSKKKLYTSRLYFDESQGGVLGANFMMGHEILFDVEHQIVGFSESSCDYTSVSPEEESTE